MELTLTHHCYDLCPTVGVDVVLEFTDGDRYHIASWERGSDDLDALTHHAQDLADAFLWGDGAGSIVNEVHAFDKSKQSRRVREAMPPG